MVKLIQSPRSESIASVFQKDVDDRNDKDVMLLVNYCESNAFLCKLAYPVIEYVAHVVRREVRVLLLFMYRREVRVLLLFMYRREVRVLLLFMYRREVRVLLLFMYRSLLFMYMQMLVCVHMCIVWSVLRACQTDGHRWLCHTDGHRWLCHTDGHRWLCHTDGHRWLCHTDGHTWLCHTDGHTWLCM
jgi:hypothetical protein